MDSSRRTSSQRDTTVRSSQDASYRSRSYDVIRHSNPGHNRTYSTYDARQTNDGNAERQANDTINQGGSTSGDDRAYSTYDVGNRSSSHRSESRYHPYSGAGPS